MFVVSLLKWWYSAGYQARFFMLRERLASTYDYFSVDLLLKTLFAPFRQISAGRVDGPIGVKLRAFFDRLISRIIGGIVRSIVLVVGCVTMVVEVVLFIGILLIWAVIPLFPAAGIVIAIVAAGASWL